CQYGCLASGDDCLVAPWEVAKIKNCTAKSCQFINRYVVHKITVAILYNRCVFQAVPGKTVSRIGNCLILNIKPEHMPILADKPAEEHSIVTIAACRINDRITLIDGLFH